MQDLRKQKIFKNFTAVETKVADGTPRTLVVKISTPTPDRSKDTVQPSGMVADNFLKNPVVMFAHNYADMPIAKCSGLKVQDTGILATVQFPDEGVYEKADTIYTMYKEGFLNAWSIGFMPLDYDENEQGGYNFKSWELFEFSSVPVPDNPEALTIMRSKGINVDAVLEKKEDTSGEPKEDEPVNEEPAKAADDEAEPYTDDTKITDLTVGDLKDIFEDVLESGDDDDDETKQVDSIEQKDVNEVLVLSYVLDCLSYFISYFKDNNVSQDSIDKLTQALALVLDVTKEQAELGKKSIVLKTGRTISAKHEGMLQDACDHIDKAAEKVKIVLGSVVPDPDDEETDDDGKDDGDKSFRQMDPFLQKIANSLKTNNQKTDLTLRLLKTIVSDKEKGGEIND